MKDKTTYTVDELNVSKKSKRMYHLAEFLLFALIGFAAGDALKLTHILATGGAWVPQLAELVTSVVLALVSFYGVHIGGQYLLTEHVINEAADDLKAWTEAIEKENKEMSAA